ncbi:MAG: hypothetical protein ACLP5E_27435 [Streptosporangiaceae bacterium]
MCPNEITWRIRLTLSDDPHSRALFQEALEALSDQPVGAVRLVPRSTGKAEITGEVMIGLGQGEALGTLLGALHIISPQVFVTRADPPPPPATSPESLASR